MSSTPDPDRADPLDRYQTGTLHHTDGTTEPVRCEPIEGPFNDHRAINATTGEPLKIRQGDHVTIDKRMPGQSFLLADKVSGRRPYVSQFELTSKRLPAPRVTLEPPRRVEAST